MLLKAVSEVGRSLTLTLGLKPWLSAQEQQPGAVDATAEVCDISFVYICVCGFSQGSSSHCSSDFQSW